MKKQFIYLAVMFIMIGTACAQTTGSTASDSTFTSRLWDVMSGKASITDFALYQVLPYLAGGVLSIALVLILQRLGFDVIGMTFNFLFFIFDLFFSILRFSLASEGNLVAFMVIFLLLWLAILFL